MFTVIIKKRLAKLEEDYSKALIELHELKELKSNIINSINDNKAELKALLLKENRKKRKNLDKIFELNYALECWALIQNNILDNWFNDE